MELRTLREADVEQVWQLDQHAFHVPPEREEFFKRWFDPERMVGLFDGPRLVAMTGAYDLGQFFGGRSVPMGGVHSVAVVPDKRGGRLAGRVMQGLLEAMHERGQVLSTLWPATTRLYRNHGWEVAGACVIRTVAPAVLRRLPAPAGVDLRPSGPDDLSAVADCYARAARPIDGHLDFSERFWRRRTDVPGASGFVASAEDGAGGGGIRGYLAYRQHDGEHSHLGGPFVLTVEDLFAETRDAALALWRLLGSWSSQVERIVYRGPPEDPLLLMLPEQELGSLAGLRWMTRAVDAAGAVAARGYRPGVAAEVDLELRDAQLAHNRGRFTLVVGDGKGHLEPGGSGAIVLDIGAFTSLYTGWASTGTLARAGRLTGGSAEQRALLDAVFAGPTPWTPHEF